MPQSPTLFPTTVHANISRFAAVLDGEGEALDARVVAAASAAGAHELILSLPQGYATMLSASDGHGVSAGQAQAVALSRALFGDPVLLLLDEPNAHLDTEGEARLAATLRALSARGATVIVSTHRTGLLPVLDKVMVLQDGRIQIYGDRAEVLRPASATMRGAA
jgi:ATP-binding cassette subfamily C protein